MRVWLVKREITAKSTAMYTMLERFNRPRLPSNQTAGKKENNCRPPNFKTSVRWLLAEAKHNLTTTLTKALANEPRAVMGKPPWIPKVRRFTQSTNWWMRLPPDEIFQHINGWQRRNQDVQFIENNALNVVHWYLSCGGLLWKELKRIYSMITSF